MKHWNRSCRHPGRLNIRTNKKGPWPPGYMHRNIRPNSSAWTRPAGVNSPPHLRMSSSDGSFGTSFGKIDNKTNEWAALFFHRKLCRDVGLPCDSPSSLLLAWGRPRGWYFNCTFRLIPEKWPYLSKTAITVYKTNSGRTVTERKNLIHFQDRFQLFEFASFLFDFQVGVAGFHLGEQRTWNVQHFLQLSRFLQL